MQSYQEMSKEELYKVKEGLTENRFVDPVAFFQPDRVIGAGPIFLVFHAASSLSRVLRRDSTIGRS